MAAVQPEKSSGTLPESGTLPDEMKAEEMASGTLPESSGTGTLPDKMEAEKTEYQHSKFSYLVGNNLFEEMEDNMIKCGHCGILFVRIGNHLKHKPAC